MTESTRVRWSVGLLALALAGCGGGSGDAPAGTAGGSAPVRLNQPVAYAPALPNAGFPQPQAVLDTFVQDEPAMRRHAWAMWASLTAPTPSGVPVMLTWYNNPEIFGAGTIASPRVFLPTMLVGPRDNFGNGDPPTEANLYNQAYRDHVRAHGYQWRDTLRDLVGRASNVVDFPAEAIAVKTVWWPVRHDGLTALPVWDDQPTRPLEWGTGVGELVDRGAFGPLTPDQQAELKSRERQGNEWGTFARLVAVGSSPQETAEVDFFDPADPTYATSARRSARVVPVDRFFTFRLTDQGTVDRLNNGVMGQMTERFWGRPLTQDDSLALVAVHVTTRETEDWVWATFWWHDGETAAPPGLPAPFDRFRLAVTQSADVPRAADGGPNVTFNPYLEAGFSLGTRSNCMGCHQRAGWRPEGTQHPQPVQRGTMRDDDPEFAGVLRTHFLWSLVFRPRANTPAPPPPGGVPDP